MARKASSKPSDSTANLGFEAKLWLTADTARRVSADCILAVEKEAEGLLDELLKGKK